MQAKNYTKPHVNRLTNYSIQKREIVSIFVSIWEPHYLLMNRQSNMIQAKFLNVSYIILTEITLSITNWENPDEEYYVDKYPALADSLQAVFELMKLFRPEQLRSWTGSVSRMALMTLALNDPDLRARLIILDIAPVAYPPRFANVIKGLQQLPVDQIRSRREADQALAAFVPLASMRTFLLTNLVRREAGFAWRVNLPSIVAAMPAIEGFASSSQEPSSADVLFLRGEQSNYVDSAGEAEISRLFPQGRIETIADAGHWVHADQPQALIERVRLELE